ncbi:MAG: 4Fe-4S cluster-binding domain-containing protein [Lentisphaeria bacterium]|nr:4Fe-4S cluster-binding domain-containing protein [Lentisphaeria bacterium]
MSGVCELCPRRCGVVRPETLTQERPPGVCASPLQPVVARAALHFWEEPVISGTRGSGAVFFGGCNLHCVFCQNHGISTRSAGKQITAERLRQIYFELIAQGAHNIDLVTPTHFTEAILTSLAEPLPVPVVWNSNAYERVETLRRLAGKVQIYLPDLKYADDRPAARYSSAPDYFETARAAILEMFSQTGPFRMGDDGLLRSGVVIRHLILPGCIENSKRVIDFVAETFKPGTVLFSLMRQYLPCGKVSPEAFPELDRRITEEEYHEVEQYLFDSPVEDGFVQEADSAAEEFIPVFDGSGV